MSLQPRLVVSPTDLAAEFDPATIDRGIRYAREGRIREARWADDGYLLIGRCLGSGSRVYRVEVGFVDLDGPTIDWAACDCPVGEFCKHAVALLLTVATQQRQPAAPDRWRDILTAVLDELSTPPAHTGDPIALQFGLTAPSRYQPGGLTTLRPMVLGKRGTWIKTGLTWQRLLYDGRAGGFNPAQYGAVRDVAAALQQAALSHNGQIMVVNLAAPPFWSRLAAAQDAGVAMIADDASGLRAVELVKSAQVRLDFAAGEEGGAVLSAHLLIDGEQIDPSDAALIGRPESHGMAAACDAVLRLGAFNPVPGPATLALLVAGRQVHIPADGVGEVALSVLPRLTGAVPVEIEEGLFTPPVIRGPLVVLTVTMTDSGARAYWSTRYDVNDKSHDFDPDSVPQRTGYRDAAAENDGWQQAGPALRAVAGAAHSWPSQAAVRIRQRMLRGTDAGAVVELQAIGASADAATAAAAASIATLRGAIDLTAAEVAVLCVEVLPHLTDSGLIIEIDRGAPDFRAARTDPQLRFGGGGEPVHTDWFDLNVSVQVDGITVALSDVIAELSAGATHMLLEDGVYFRLDTPELARLSELLEEARALGEIDGDKVNASSLNATLWDELLALGVVDDQLAHWQENLRRLAAARPPAPVEPPNGLDVTLRDYQRDGLDWLSFLWDNGLGGVLADDMGLGKTVQTLALIARANAAGAGRFLVVAPTSVVGNWATECTKFTPGLTSVAINGSQARSDRPLAEVTTGADIVITSYTLLRIDYDSYAQIDWAGVILDEAQFVKNHNSKTHQCVRRLDAGFKLAITGTPMENNLMELWALLSITVPGLFPSPKAFGEYFRKPIESGAGSERLPVLRRRIKSVMLRRTKAQVLAELPPKQEQELCLDLGAKHRKIYDTRLARERQKVLGLLGDWEKNRFQIFRSLTVLRQLSLHAGLVDATDGNVGSTKIDFLVEQLPQLVAEGHSALVFSQFTGFLAILQAQLDAVGVTYSYLDGSVPAHRRKAALAQFAAGESRVFLISLKAGGFGINLTQADYCFLCDPWWSPAAEAQAVDRAHRIGQTRPVSVYRLVSADTIEEKVVALQQRKRELFAAVLDDGDLFGSKITAADVRELLG